MKKRSCPIPAILHLKIENKLGTSKTYLDNNKAEIPTIGTE